MLTSAGDPIKELIDPALNGTTGILRALHAHAPSTKRVVVTSSFASILSEEGITDPGTVYTEDSWNPDGLSAVTRSPASAYRVSKKLAERAAWDFVAENKPSFDLVTVCPPLVLGPVADHLVTLDAVNTSNERVAQLLRGDWREKIPPSGPVTLWVDVRDVARAHIAAIENPEAGGRRLFTVAGFSSNREIADIVRRNFPDYADRLPTPEVPGGEGRDPSKSFGYDSSRTDAFLKIPWINLETSISDLVKVFRKHGL